MSTRHRYKIHDKFYDLTEFIKIHPGGTDMFNHLVENTNITPMIYSYHKNPKAILDILPKYEIPFPDGIIINYDTDYSYDKYCELKKLVYDEIHKKKIPLYWSNTEILYNAITILLYLSTWTYCFINADDLSYLWMVLLSIEFVSICLLIGHETSHYIGFKNQKYNKLLSQIISSPVFNMYEWKFDHNYTHHCFTNTDFDKDFNEPKEVMRYSPLYKLYFNHKFQYIYIIIICAIYGNYLVFLQNIRNKNFIPLSIGLALIYKFGFLKILVFFGCTGFGFTFLASLSHINNNCIQPNNDKKNDFLYNQVSSSMNYRTDDFITRFICIGLDIQIEHHLFPNIPHSSLRQIQHIVRGYCEKNDIPYILQNINLNKF
jgi:linoleoyl-CoA desaturase